MDAEYTLGYRVFLGVSYFRIHSSDFQAAVAKKLKTMAPFLVLSFSYTSSISLSLALFNLLPLPRLDGSEILDTLLSTSTSMAFAPVLPFSRDNKDIGSLYSDNEREGKLDRILQRSVTILQGILANGNGTKQGGMSPNRKKYVRIAIQGTVALLAGLNFAANIYRQLYR